MQLITTELLKTIIADQREEYAMPEDYLSRQAESALDALAENREIIVLTGIRRCGKSVLLEHLRQHARESDYYFNFEDERLAMFTVNDFQTLQEVLIELFGVQKTFYFDEIQNITGWEMFIRRLYNAGNKIYLTGSNANLFSDTLGSRLTGRYIPLTIYPISFFEYLQHEQAELLTATPLSTVQKGSIRQCFREYCQRGGIPEYLKYQRADYLRALYESILYRDIIARYRLASDGGIKKLVFYLASHCGKEMTYNSLKKSLGINSASTISDYCRYLENSYLCFFVNRYSDSLKTQLQMPKKIYFIDPMIAKTVGFRISADAGRMLENLVFLELKRRNHEVYYYQGTKECDFVTRQQGKVTQAIQVCQELSSEKTKQREVAGLVEAMQTFSLNRGVILTENTQASEVIKTAEGQLTIDILPIWQWLAFQTEGQ